jgi:hypothetical protein
MSDGRFTERRAALLARYQLHTDVVRTAPDSERLDAFSLAAGKIAALIDPDVFPCAVEGDPQLFAEVFWFMKVVFPLHSLHSDGGGLGKKKYRGCAV